jgi:excisionase family DNA binding protein
MSNSTFKPSQSCYSINEAAAYLRISRDTVSKLIKRGLLKASKALRHVKILGESVETFYERTS